MVAQVPVPADRIAEFCRKWNIVEFSLFGSVLTEDFRPDSDVDVLVVFAPEISHSIEGWIEMEEELRTIFDREVDLVEKRTLENPFRRHHILNNRRVVYAA